MGTGIPVLEHFTGSMALAGKAQLADLGGDAEHVLTAWSHATPRRLCVTR